MPDSQQWLSYISDCLSLLILFDFTSWLGLYVALECVFCLSTSHKCEISVRQARRQTALMSVLRRIGRFTSIPSSTGISADARKLNGFFPTGPQCSFQLDSRGPANEKLSSLIYWWPFWWTDRNTFLGQELMPLLIDCTKGERSRYRLELRMHREKTCAWLASCIMHVITLIYISDNKRWISNPALWPL